MNEELLIKVKVDTSSVTTSINSLKNQVANVNKTIATTSKIAITLTALFIKIPPYDFGIT